MLGRTDSRRAARLLATVGILTGIGLLMTGCVLLDNHSQLTIATLMEDHRDATLPLAAADRSGSEKRAAAASSYPETDAANRAASR